MKKTTRHTLAAFAAALLLVPGAALHAADGKAAGTPNIVVILADDLGYGDVQCYNRQRGKIPTPNLDRLAAEGMRFTDGHSSSGVCSPSRYTLLTGRYHWRTRLQAGIVGVFGDPLIAPDRLTIAGLAKQHGYRTACVGKWHLGRDWGVPPEKRALFHIGKSLQAATDEHRAAWQEVFAKPIAGGPTTRGFDAYFGTDVPNWPPYCFIENDRTVGIPSELLPAALLGDHLASLPGPALKDWKLDRILPTLGDRACNFVADQAKAKQPFLLYLPLTAPHTPLAVNDAWKGKSGLGLAYPDFVMETDAVVGRVLTAIEQSGVAQNTLVLFTSDNGCAPYIGAKAMEAQGHFPSGPLRGYKGDVWEGGHRVPFVVRWPGVVKPGSVCGQLVHQADVMATLADVLRAKLPDNAGEDSFSLLPLLKGEDRPIREHAVSCASRGVAGLRSGPWKLIFEPDPLAKTDVHLYNLEGDVGETRNLAAQQAERVADMKASMERLIANGRSTPGTAQKNDVEVSIRKKALPVSGKKATRAKLPRAPNIVFILADDIGYGDWGCYGATKIRTPNIDRLAAAGRRFTDAHSPSAVCTPTRYALMTGEYAWRKPGTGILPGTAALIVEPGRVTVSSLLKQAGYVTGVVGKWHLGLGPRAPTDYNGEIEPGPLEVGFDYAWLLPATGDRTPCVWIENHRVVGLDPADPITLDYSIPRGHPESYVNGIPRIGKQTGGKAALWKDDEIAEVLTKKAVAFIEKHKARPFFLYFATHDIHVPRMPHARFRGASQAGVRGDVVQEFDWSVGEVMAALERLDLAGDTLIVVTSDNGGVLDTNGPDSVNSGTVETNCGHRHNGPLRDGKGSPYEGGTRVPFVVRWPGHVKPGTSEELICHVDLLATAAAITGQKLAGDAGPDSFNVLPALLGEKLDRPCRDHLVEHGNRLALRQGPWKLIPAARPASAAKGKAGQRGPAVGELYNLANDLGETTNLAAEHPQRVKEMTGLLQKIRADGRSRP